MGQQTKQEKNNHICIALLAHVDAGKTTLSESLLYACGALRKVGRVDHKDSFLDTDTLERERGITIFSKQARLSMQGREVTLLDTPGHVDFSAEMERTLQVLDAAVLLISAADGIQGHTQTLWNLLKKYQIPTILFINKMDQPLADHDKILQQLQQTFSSECIDFGAERNTMFWESIAVAQEDSLEYFLEHGDLPQEEIARLVSCRSVFPCFFGSALKQEGITELIEGIASYIETPRYPSAFGARVYKITRDQQGNRLTHMKITGGQLHVRDLLSSANWSKEEKVNQIRLYNGEKYDTTEQVTAGEICCVTGLSESFAGEGLGIENYEIAPVLSPVLNYCVQGPAEMDVHTLLAKLKLLEEENPELHIVWDEELGEIHAQLMGEVQIEILKCVVKDRFGIEISFDDGEVVYLETIADTVEGVGHFEPLRHYAEVHLLLEPGEPGSGLVFETDCSEDVLDRNWQRLVLTHLREKEHVGVLTGSALADMKITLVAGRAHTKHTEGGDFRQATYRALRQGLMQAETVLLEPWYDFRLSLPAGAVGRAMNDIDRMKGTIAYSADGCIVGSAPVSAMQNYQREVTAYTAGEGKLSVALKGYFPCHNTEEVVAQIGYDAQSDLENTADSVFCAHGAGFIVPWDQVFSYMHLPPVPGQDKSGEEWYPGQWLPDAANFHAKTGEEEAWIGTEEIDRILDRTYNANKKDKDAGATNGYKKKRIIESSPASASGGGKQKDAGVEYLLVDGYNVIFAWQELAELARVNMDSARGRLLDILCNYQGIRRCELIVVFDAYRVEGHQTEACDYHNIHVVYTKEAETADAYIERFAHEHASRYRVTVATSDGLEQIIIRGAGCILLSAREFEQEVKEKNRQLQAEYDSRKDHGKVYLRDQMPSQVLDGSLEEQQ